MTSYMLIIDMTLILPQIKHLKVDLGIFSKATPILELSAKDPDDACYLAYKTFCDIIIVQEANADIHNLLKELKNDFVITGILSDET